MTTTPDVRAIPLPTADVAQAKSDLRSHGVAIVAGALPPDRLRLVRETLYRVAQSDRDRGWTRRFEADFDDTNQRVWNLPSRDPVFLDLVEDPIALDFVRSTLGWPALLSNISANITSPGGGDMYLHADQGYMPQPWGGVQGINVMWCIDDFTEANGATRVVPGSHLENRTPNYTDDPKRPMVPVEAPAGSVVVMDGRVWHQTGRNRTDDQTRAGIFAWYTPPIYLPQENWWLSLNPSIRHFGSDELLTLFGYKVTSFGRVYGRSPI